MSKNPSKKSKRKGKKVRKSKSRLSKSGSKSVSKTSNQIQQNKSRSLLKSSNKIASKSRSLSKSTVPSQSANLSKSTGKSRSFSNSIQQSSAKSKSVLKSFKLSQKSAGASSAKSKSALKSTKLNQKSANPASSSKSKSFSNSASFNQQSANSVSTNSTSLSKSGTLNQQSATGASIISTIFSKLANLGQQSANSESLDKSANSVSANSKSLDKSANSASANSKSLDKSANSANSKSLDKSANSVSANSKSLDKSANSVSANSKSLDKSANSASANSKSLDKSANSASANSKSLDKSANSASANSKSLDKSANLNQKSANNPPANSKSLDKSSKLNQKSTNTSSTNSKTLDKSSKSNQNSGSTASTNSKTLDKSAKQNQKSVNAASTKTNSMDKSDKLNQKPANTKLSVKSAKLNQNQPANAAPANTKTSDSSPKHTTKITVAHTTTTTTGTNNSPKTGKGAVAANVDIGIQVKTKAPPTLPAPPAGKAPNKSLFKPYQKAIGRLGSVVFKNPELIVSMANFKSPDSRSEKSSGPSPTNSLTKTASKSQRKMIKFARSKSNLGFKSLKFKSFKSKPIGKSSALPPPRTVKFEANLQTDQNGKQVVNVQVKTKTGNLLPKTKRALLPAPNKPNQPATPAPVDPLSGGKSKQDVDDDPRIFNLNLAMVPTDDNKKTDKKIEDTIMMPSPDVQPKSEQPTPPPVAEDNQKKQPFNNPLIKISGAVEANDNTMKNDQDVPVGSPDLRQKSGGPVDNQPPPPPPPFSHTIKINVAVGPNTTDQLNSEPLPPIDNANKPFNDPLIKISNAMEANNNTAQNDRPFHDDPIAQPDFQPNSEPLPPMDNSNKPFNDPLIKISHAVEGNDNNMPMKLNPDSPDFQPNSGSMDITKQQPQQPFNQIIKINLAVGPNTMNNDLAMMPDDQAKPSPDMQILPKCQPLVAGTSKQAFKETNGFKLMVPMVPNESSPDIPRARSGESPLPPVDQPKQSKSKTLLPSLPAPEQDNVNPFWANLAATVSNLIPKILIRTESGTQEPGETVSMLAKRLAHVSDSQTSMTDFEIEIGSRKNDDDNSNAIQPGLLQLQLDSQNNTNTNNNNENNNMANNINNEQQPQQPKPIIRTESGTEAQMETISDLAKRLAHVSDSETSMTNFEVEIGTRKNNDDNQLNQQQQQQLNNPNNTNTNNIDTMANNNNNEPQQQQPPQAEPQPKPVIETGPQEPKETISALAKRLAHVSDSETSIADFEVEIGGTAAGGGPRMMPMPKDPGVNNQQPQQQGPPQQPQKPQKRYLVSYRAVNSPAPVPIGVIYGTVENYQNCTTNGYGNLLERISLNNSDKVQTWLDVCLVDEMDQAKNSIINEFETTNAQNLIEIIPLVDATAMIYDESGRGIELRAESQMKINGNLATLALLYDNNFCKNLMAAQGHRNCDNNQPNNSINKVLYDNKTHKVELLNGMVNFIIGPGDANQSIELMMVVSDQKDTTIAIDESLFWDRFSSNLDAVAAAGLATSTTTIDANLSRLSNRGSVRTLSQPKQRQQQFQFQQPQFQKEQSQQPQQQQENSMSKSTSKSKKQSFDLSAFENIENDSIEFPLEYLIFIRQNRSTLLKPIGLIIGNMNGHIQTHQSLISDNVGHVAPLIEVILMDCHDPAMMYQRNALLQTIGNNSQFATEILDGAFCNIFAESGGGFIVTGNSKIILFAEKIFKITINNNNNQQNSPNNTNNNQQQLQQQPQQQQQPFQMGEQFKQQQPQQPFQLAEQFKPKQPGQQQQFKLKVEMKCGETNVMIQQQKQQFQQQPEQQQQQQPFQQQQQQQQPIQQQQQQQQQQPFQQQQQQQPSEDQPLQPFQHQQQQPFQQQQQQQFEPIEQATPQVEPSNQRQLKVERGEASLVIRGPGIVAFCEHK